MAAPVILFAYNRLDHIKRAISALQRNELVEESPLYIFSDAAKIKEHEPGVLDVRSFLQKIEGFKSVTVTHNPLNLGLASSVIKGVGEVLQKHEHAVVLEDDLEASPYFLKFMNEALELYKSEARVISIHGYSFPVKDELPETYFLRDPGCWGWATWKRGWALFDPEGERLLGEIKKRKLVSEFNFDDSFDYFEMLEAQVQGRNSSWAIRWYASAFLNNKLTLHPRKSLIKNMGHDASGTHAVATKNFDVDFTPQPISVYSIPVEENARARTAIIRFLRSIKASPLRSFLRKVKTLVMGLGNKSNVTSL